MVEAQDVRISLGDNEKAEAAQFCNYSNHSNTRENGIKVTTIAAKKGIDTVLVAPANRKHRKGFQARRGKTTKVHHATLSSLFHFRKE